MAYLDLTPERSPGDSFRIEQDTSIGRGPGNCVVIDDATVSASHCMILLSENGFVVTDLQSTNGTFINGEKIEKAVLKDGDSLRVGDVSFSVRFRKEVAPARSVAPVSAEDDAIPIESAPPMAKAPRTRATKVCSGKRRTGRRLAVSALLLLLAAGAVWFVGLSRSGNCDGAALFSARANAALRKSFAFEGVKLVVEDPIGADHRGELVTSGVPIPQGAVKDAVDLSLLDKDGRAVPCQFAPTCLWPDGSIKWALLDFLADVDAGTNAVYRFCGRARNPQPPRPVTVTETEFGVSIANGRLEVKLSRTSSSLIDSIALDGKAIVSRENPVMAQLVSGDAAVYRCSSPDEIKVEEKGPVRATVLLRGHFVGDDGSKIYDGKVGYDLRVHACADQPRMRMDFTLRNDGWYGYRNEYKQRQWLYVKSLNISVPVVIGTEFDPEVAMTGKRLPVGPGTHVAINQWYKFPYSDPVRSKLGILTQFGTTNVAQHCVVGGMAGKHRGFYSVWTINGGMTRGPERVEGKMDLHLGSGCMLRMVNRHFTENHPRGFAVRRGAESGTPVEMVFQMLPEGGWWPEHEEAFKARTYQFEGGRHKTATLLFGLGNAGSESNEIRMLNQPLMARAPAAWYRDSGAVCPLADPAGMRRNADPTIIEALERYDRMQRAKVILELGDPVGPDPFGRDRYGRVSIPSLYERYPEVYAGWMNFGDLVWSFGYCSLYYGWPYSMLSQYLRLGDREFLDVGENMARHRYDIDQYHVMKTKTYLGGFQRYEKGEHGHLARQVSSYGKQVAKWELNPAPSHTWNRGLLLHWVLRGDRRSLEAAEQNSRAFYNFFYKQHGLAKKESLPWGEFRTQGRAMDNWLALYEYTGKKECLDWANEIFGKSLLAMERKNGGNGHICRHGHQSSQFLAYIVEPVCRLHSHTADVEVVEFLRRVLDWQREKGCIWGMTRQDTYYPVRWRSEWDSCPDPEPGAPLPLGFSLYYSMHFADGYAYLYDALGRKKDLEFARQLFRDVVFYYYYLGVKGDERSPIGYHFGNDISGWTPKFQAFTGSHGSIYMQAESGI